MQDTAGCNDYLPVAGLPDLRKAIAKFHKEWEGVTLNEEGLVVGPGSKELIYLTMAVFSGTVWLCAPAWTTYNPQARLAGHKAKLLEQPQHQEWKLRPATVEQGLNGLPGPHMLILTNPGNPSGCAYTREELVALVTVFRRLSVIVLSDEIYARLEYTGQHVCMSELYPEVTISGLVAILPGGISAGLDIIFCFRCQPGNIHCFLIQIRSGIHCYFNSLVFLRIHLFRTFV